MTIHEPKYSIADLEKMIKNNEDILAQIYAQWPDNDYSERTVAFRTGTVQARLKALQTQLVDRHWEAACAPRPCALFVKQGTRF